MKNIAVQFGIFLEARSTEVKSEKVHLQALALCSRSGELHGLKVQLTYKIIYYWTDVGSKERVQDTRKKKEKKLVL